MIIMAEVSGVYMEVTPSQIASAIWCPFRYLLQTAGVGVPREEYFRVEAKLFKGRIYHAFFRLRFLLQGYKTEKLLELQEVADFCNAKQWAGYDCKDEEKESSVKFVLRLVGRPDAYKVIDGSKPKVLVIEVKSYSGPDRHLLHSVGGKKHGYVVAKAWRPDLYQVLAYSYLFSKELERGHVFPHIKYRNGLVAIPCSLELARLAVYHGALVILQAHIVTKENPPPKEPSKLNHWVEDVWNTEYYSGSRLGPVPSYPGVCRSCMYSTVCPRGKES